MSDDPDNRRLDSWKAIANYLGKSVRTARRWETEEGLPVHRHMHKSQGSVYAFAAEIDAWRNAARREPPAPAPAEAAPDTRSTAEPRLSIAVLPFNYLGPNRDSAYIADGFTEEIITGLSRVRPLRVISWTSSMTLRDSDKSARAIGRQLGVGRLVEGTVRHNGARIRVSARLVDSDTDDRVWSHSYEGALDDLFAIQERIAREVVDSLELPAGTMPSDRLTEAPFGNIAAWQCLVQARQAALRWRKDAIDEAVALLRRGLAVAGDDARLHAALGRTQLHYREAGIDLGETPLEVARECARTVLALAPDHAAGPQLDGWIHYATADIQSAVDALKVARDREPMDPDTLTLLANCYLISGRVDVARPIIAQALSIDPLTPLTQCMPGWADALEGNFDAALPAYRNMMDMDPGNPVARLFYVYMLVAAGRHDDARRVAADMPAALRDTPPGQIVGLVDDALSGRPPETSPSASLRALANASSDMFPRMLAQALAMAGDTEGAIEWTAVAVDRGFVNYPFLAEHDPLLSPLAGNPRYDRVLETAKRRWQAFRA